MTQFTGASVSLPLPSWLDYFLVELGQHPSNLTWRGHPKTWHSLDNTMIRYQYSALSISRSMFSTEILRRPIVLPRKGEAWGVFILVHSLNKF